MWSDATKVRNHPWEARVLLDDDFPNYDWISKEWSFMTERRRELLKRGKEAVKVIEGMKTYNSEGRLVLSPIENANEYENENNEKA